MTKPITDLYRASRSGMAFTTSSGKVAVANDASIRATLENPVGSGRVLVLTEIVVGLGNYATAWGEVFINPATNTPTTTRTPRNRFVNSGISGRAVIKIDTGSAMSGGVDTGIAIPFGKGRTSVPLFGFRIPQGITMGMNPPQGIGGATDGSISIVHWEEPR